MQRLRLNIFYNAFGNVFSVVFGFVSTAVLVDNFDLEIYGIFTLCMVFAGYFGFLDFGVDQATTKFVSQYRQNQAKVGDVISSALLFSALAGLVLFIVFLILAFYQNRIFNVSPANSDLVQNLFIILSFYTLFFWPIKLSLNVLQGYEKYGYTVIQNILLVILYVINLIVCIKKGYPMDLYFLGVCGSRLLVYLILWLECFRLLNLRLRLSIASLREMLSFSFYVFLTKILGVLNYQTDTLIISTFLPIEKLSGYDFASKFHSLPKMANAILANPLIPNSASNVENNDYLRKMVLDNSRLNVGLITGGIGCLILFIQPIYANWLSKELSSLAIYAQVFVSYWLLNAHTGVFSAVLLGMGRQKLIFRYSLFVTVANLVLSLLLVNYFGVLGVILGTVVSNVVGMPVFLWIALRNLGIEFSSYIHHVILPQMRSVFCLVIVFYIIREFDLNEMNIADIIIYGIMFMGIQFLTFFFRKEWLRL